jgi:hypothetical protein
MIVGVEFASNTVIAGLDPAIQAGRGEMLEHLQSSWLDLIRPSTPSPLIGSARQEGVDHRVKPGDDDFL